MTDARHDPAGPGLRVLVVDDSEEGRRVTRLVLERAGFDVIEAGTVRDGAREARTCPDAIVLDVNLPDGSGLDLARALRVDPQTSSIPIVQTSAIRTRPADQVIGLDSGADVYLVHPIDPALLVATTRTVLRARDAERAAREIARRLADLQDVTAALNQAATRDEVVRAVLDAGMSAIRVNAAALALLGPDDNVLTVRGSRGLCSGRPTTFPIIASLPLADAVRKRTMVTVGAGAEWQRRYGSDIGMPAAGSTVVAVPLGNQATFGAVRFDFGEPPGPADLGYLTTLADQAGQALERAGRYEASQQGLRESEERARRILEHAPDAIVVFNAADGRCLDANPAAERLFGLSRDRLIGAHSADLSPPTQPDGRPSIDAANEVNARAARGETPVFEWVHVRGGAGGEEIRCEVRLLTLPDPGRSLIRGSIVEIGERKRAEAAERRATEAARRAEQEHEIAISLQRSFLPTRLPRFAGLTLAALYEAADQQMEIGGDWYEAIALPHGRVALCVGDVVGHGLAAATAMGQLRSAVAAVAATSQGPADVLDRLEWFAEKIPDAAFATVCYAELDPATGELRYACAGHPPPLLVTASGDASYLEDGRSPPLRGLGRRPRTEAGCIVPAGARLTLYSDGLFERRSVPLDERLAALAESGSRRCGQKADVYNDGLLRDMLEGSRLLDDVAILSAFIHTVPPTRFHRRFDAVPSELAPARHTVAAWAARSGLNRSAIERLVLVCGEALANAVEHAYIDLRPGEVELTITASPTILEITVRDFGRWRDSSHVRPNRGNGLPIIGKLSSHVDVQQMDPGTAVVIRFPREGVAK